MKMIKKNTQDLIDMGLLEQKSTENGMVFRSYFS